MVSSSLQIQWILSTSLLMSALNFHFMMTSAEMTSADIMRRSVGAVTSDDDPTTTTFKAAVYEHIPIYPIRGVEYTRKLALEVMNKNLDIYKEQTIRAKNQGAQIIVFPEDGIYGNVFTRATIRPFLETIPDPKLVTWNPCTDPTRFPDTEVQHTLSCMARNSGIYVVANIGDIIPCTIKTDPHCPKDGRYQFNTNVAFDTNGTIVAKYHKYHLFYEAQFNVPEPEEVYFDTPFGRVGLIVCFDVMFQNPALNLVTKHNVTIIAFPTAWMDVLPFLSAVGFHSAFARGLKVNFLSANFHLPKYRFQGSGIYGPDGPKSYYYDNDYKSPGKLLVSTLDILKPTPLELKPENNNFQENQAKNSQLKVSPYQSKTEEFQSDVFHDRYTFRTLDSLFGQIDVCQKNVCCSLNYTMGNSHDRQLFAFGAFDGLHTKDGKYYFQNCILLKCASDTNRSTCGQETKSSRISFITISMEASFETSFIYPEVVTSTRNNQLEIHGASTYSFEDNNKIKAEFKDEAPLLSASLIGRIYERDVQTVLASREVGYETSSYAGNRGNGGGSSNVVVQSIVISMTLATIAVMLLF